MTHLLHSRCSGFREAEQHRASAVEFLLNTDEFFIRISTLAIGSGQTQLGQVDLCQQREGFFQEPLPELAEDFLFENVDRSAFTET